MKLPIPTTADLIAIDEYSDVREYARREAERPDPTQVTPEPPVALPRPERRTPPPPPPVMTWRQQSPPPPPPAAGPTYTGRSFWFTPSLAIAIGLCVVGVLALMRLGPASASEDMVARALPAAAAPRPAEVTQVSAARDPQESSVQAAAAAAPVAEDAQAPSVDCEGAAAPTLASSEPVEEPEQSGMGLGLWIARSIVERHGGRIYPAEVERGAKLCVVLPEAPREDPGRG